MIEPKTAPLLVGDEEAARLLGISVRLLRKDRGGARVIPFVRLGRRVMYSVAALVRFANGDLK